MASARDSILDHVTRNPGTSTCAVASTFDVDPSTADYHLKRLQRSGAALGETVGRAACWYPSGGYCPVLRRAIPLLARGEALRVARALDHVPRSAAFVARASGVKPGSVRWIASGLEDAGIVERTRTGRLLLARGADVCVARAAGKARCEEWGRCPVSKAWARRHG